MGNRAMIAFGANAGKTAIYLHWNGGRASVEAFLQAARHMGINYVEVGNDAAEEAALKRIAEMIAKHFFGQERIGMNVDISWWGDVGDNGTFVIDSGLNIVRNVGRSINSPEINPEKTRDIFECITQRAPAFNY